MNMPHASNIYRLGVKELWSLARDPMMLVLIAYTFTLSVYVAATAMPETLHKAPIAIVDEDASPLSARIATAFYLPRFNPPAMIRCPTLMSAWTTATTPSRWTSRRNSSATCWPAGRRRSSSMLTPRS